MLFRGLSNTSAAVTTTDAPSPTAYARIDALLAAGYRLARRNGKEGLSLHHPSRRRRRGAPPSLLIYPDGLVATYPQETAARRRFGAIDDQGFQAFLTEVPRPTRWEIAAPTVERAFVLSVLSALGAVALWSIYDGQVAVISFLVHLVLFSAPFVAIRLFLK